MASIYHVFKRWPAAVFLVAMGTVDYSMSLKSSCTSDLSSGGTDYPVTNYSVTKLHNCPFKTLSDGTVIKTFPKLIRRVFPVSSCQDTVVTGIQICRIPDCGVNPCREGWCEETMDGYKCHCPRKFTGLNCEYVREQTSGAPSTVKVSQQPSKTIPASSPSPTTTPPTVAATVVPPTVAATDGPPTMSTDTDGSNTRLETSRTPSTEDNTSTLETREQHTTTGTVYDYELYGEGSPIPQHPGSTPAEQTTSPGKPIILGVDECSVGGGIVLVYPTTNLFDNLDGDFFNSWVDDIAYDSVDKKVYWLSTFIYDQICSATLDGREYVCWGISQNCADPERIDIDIIGRKLYCACGQSVISMNLDGTAMKKVFTYTGNRGIEHVAAADTAIFWATSKEVHKHDMMTESLLFSTENNDEVAGLSVDFVGRKLFVVVKVMNGIYNLMQMDFNGGKQSLNVTLSGEYEGDIEDFMMFREKGYFSSGGDVYEIGRGVVFNRVGCPIISHIFLGTN